MKATAGGSLRRLWYAFTFSVVLFIQQVLQPDAVLMGVFEETGFQAAGAINAISYNLWSLWLIAFGIALLLR